MVELVFQISSLSLGKIFPLFSLIRAILSSRNFFYSRQHECSKINLNILKLYVHLLGILWSLFPPFFSLLGFHKTLVEGYVLFQIRPKWSLSSRTLLSFGYSFNEAYHTSECWFIKRKSFFFSLGVLCAA